MQLHVDIRSDTKEVVLDTRNLDVQSISDPQSGAALSFDVAKEHKVTPQQG